MIWYEILIFDIEIIIWNWIRELEIDLPGEVGYEQEKLITNVSFGSSLL